MAQRNKKLQLKIILARTQFSSFVQCGARCINYFRSGSQRREIFCTKILQPQQQRTPTRTITILRQNKRIIQPRWAQRFNVGYAFTLCAVALQTLFSPQICLLSHRIPLDAHVPAEQKENIKHSSHSTHVDIKTVNLSCFLFAPFPNRTVMPTAVEPFQFKYSDASNISMTIDMANHDDLNLSVSCILY